MNIILNHRQERFRVNIAFLSRIVVRKDTSLYFAVWRLLFVILHLPNRLVPVPRFPSPSRSIHLGDVSEPNRRETPHIFDWTT